MDWRWFGEELGLYFVMKRRRDGRYRMCSDCIRCVMMMMMLVGMVCNEAHGGFAVRTGTCTITTAAGGHD